MYRLEASVGRVIGAEVFFLCPSPPFTFETGPLTGPKIYHLARLAASEP